MRFAFTKSGDRATGQEAPELRLLWGPAYLGNNGRRDQWKNAKFQAGLVLRPRPALVFIGGHENTGVIDDSVHAGRRRVRDFRSCIRTLARASFIS